MIGWSDCGSIKDNGWSVGSCWLGMVNVNVVWFDGFSVVLFVVLRVSW
jgi:hypothetical protein